jgi:hypothetical protein
MQLHLPEGEMLTRLVVYPSHGLFQRLHGQRHGVGDAPMDAAIPGKHIGQTIINRVRFQDEDDAGCSISKGRSHRPPLVSSPA